jgi:sulfofructose kinase
MELPFKLPVDREFDAAGFGTNAVDYLVRLPMLPTPGGKHEISSYAIEAGGEVASTMFGLQRLGHKTAYAGSFGDDQAGSLGMRSLEDAGVDCGYSRIVSGAATQVGFILVDENSGERTVLWQRDERLEFHSSDAPLELAGRTRLLHLTPHDTGACIAMAQAAKHSETIVSIDIDNIFDGIEELLRFVDICIASEDVPGRMTGLTDKDKALAALAENYGCPIVGVTLGAEGSKVYAAGEIIETSAFEVPGGCVDTTGAGDAFRTGFLHGVLNGVSVAQCCTYANATAALKCRRQGARLGLATGNELQTLLK